MSSQINLMAGQPKRTRHRQSTNKSLRAAWDKETPKPQEFAL